MPPPAVAASISDFRYHPAMSMTQIVLRAGEASAHLVPAMGGGIARLMLQGRDVLRPATAGDLAATGALALAEFPMAPFVNRIANDRFSWEGRTITLHPTAPNLGEALHGSAWQRPWMMVDARADEAALALSMAGGEAWPFPFHLRRHFLLAPGQLVIETELTNPGSAAMPAAIGSHPFFVARHAVLAATTSGFWTTEATIPRMHATGPLVDALRRGAPVETLDLDHCFTGWDGTARIAWPDATLTLTAEPNPRYLQIYTPRGADFFCVEPQTAMPDAVNRTPAEGGIRRLAPGETLCMRLTISLVAC